MRKISLLLAVTSLAFILLSMHPACVMGGEDSRTRLVVTKPHVNIRREPSATSRVVATAQLGEEVLRLDRQGRWYRIALGTRTTGWVHDTLVESPADGATPPGRDGGRRQPDTTRAVGVPSPERPASAPPASDVSPDVAGGRIGFGHGPGALAAALAGAAVVLGMAAWLWPRMWRRRRLRAFLHRTLPCSLDPTCFPRPKSLFGILLGLGISLESITLMSMHSGTLLREPLCWIPQQGNLNHQDLDAAVQEAVAFYATYEGFVTAMKATLLGNPPPVLPACRSEALPGPPTGARPPARHSIAQLLEERKAFASMMHALHDEAKTSLARRMGLASRFDYTTGELFRAISETADRPIVAALDHTGPADQDFFTAFARLSAVAGSSMFALSATSQLLSTVADAGGLDFAGAAGGSEGAFEGLGDLGELLLLLGGIVMTVKLVTWVGKLWRERHLRRYQSELKRQMSQITARFFEQGEAGALRVPRRVVQALAVEEERLKALVGQLRRTPIGDDPGSNIHRLGLMAAQHSHALYAQIAEKFSRDIERLLHHVCHYRKVGRPDLAGLHLYLNKDLVFVPSQWPEEELSHIRETVNLLLSEVHKSRKSHTGT
jgi:hypothetical protein